MAWTNATFAPIAGADEAGSILAMPVPVVLVHNLRGRATDLLPQRRALEALGHAVSSPDLPGHGSRQKEPFSIGESLVTIADATRSIGSPPVLVGFALGAHLAIACTAVVGGAAGILAIGCGTQALTWLLDSYRIAAASHQVLPDKGAALSSLAATTFIGGVPRHTRTTVPGQFFDTLGQLEALDTPASLAKIEVPVVLLNGQWDRFRMQERAFLAAAPDARLVRQPGVRLAGRVRRPEETNSVIADILSGMAVAKR
jgi:pimeloyl-ACP methyl ester carboxylesterase